MNFKLTSTGLKWIAIITMIIDHTGAILFPYNMYPNMLFMRIIGRLAFPIFAFLIVEGYRHTKDVKKYAIRLFLFAFISEIPFDLGFYGKIFAFEHQNVFFTLFLGLVALIVFDYLRKKNAIIAILSVYIFGTIAQFLFTDYSIFGVLLIFGIYTARTKSWVYIWIVLVNILMVFAYGSVIQLFAIPSILFLMIYNGEKGKSMKYLFYIIYPAHIMLLYLINQMIR